ncbi:hypothetical protein FA13DRAFT_112467 [Coprinellus micaceus]|uniref:C2H2-type domain-containing protein n=1 Tax=Coprinellus micaceus TaxID=71717 RepID=A0A4Y7TIJ5_COPMI|nr:hypothetical protein FA13DRAFT_112467 [Coprinellus micaceus]
MNPQDAAAGGAPKVTHPISPVSSYENMTRIRSPSTSNFQPPTHPSTGYPSPSPSLVHQIPFTTNHSDSGSSHTSSSSTTHSDAFDFGDFGFTEALSSFQDAFPSTYNDLNAVFGNGPSSSSNSSDQLRSTTQQQYFSPDALMDSSSFPIPSTSSFLTTAPLTPPQTTPLAPSSLVNSPPPLPGADFSPEASTSSLSQFPSTLPSSDSSESSSSSSSHPSDQNDPKRIYTCRHDGCEKRFARKYHRQVHENSHKPKVRLLLTCREDDCNAKFGRPHDRMRHEVAKHGLRPNFVCKECGKFFGTESKLRGHKCDLMPTQRHRWTEPGANEEE